LALAGIWVFGDKVLVLAIFSDWVVRACWACLAREIISGTAAASSRRLLHVLGAFGNLCSIRGAAREIVVLECCLLLAVLWADGTALVTKGFARYLVARACCAVRAGVLIFLELACRAIFIVRVFGRDCGGGGFWFCVWVNARCLELIVILLHGTFAVLGNITP